MTVKYTFQIKYNGVDFNHKRWDKKFRQNLKKTLQKAGSELSKTGSNSLANHIKNRYGEYADNSTPWKMAKNGKSVFFHTGFLRNSPTYELHIHSSGNYANLDVGFPKNISHPSGTSLQTIVESIVKGGSWNPSDAQRKAYWAKVGKNKILSRRKRSSTWTQPPRDFISKHFKTDNTYRVVEKYINEAIDLTNKESKVKKKL